MDRQQGFEIAQALGRRVRQLRQSRPERLTQEDLAERADISVSFLSMIERGERAPHLETLLRLALALQVSVGELFEFDEAAAPGRPRAVEPALRPIAEFVKGRGLTRRDVERLLGVARAMFKP